MSAANTPAMETLFSLELLVDYVQVEQRPWTRPGPLLAVAFRLLDFPTLLVHQTEPERAEYIRRSWECGKENAAPERLPDGSNIRFSKGKSCLFKISLASLHSHLSNTPLYAMLLDVFPRVPKLLGSCLISLAGAVEKIRREVEEHGVAVPSVQGSKGLHALCNLMGGKVGHISVRYRLLSLGAGLLPHIPENQVQKVEMRDTKDFPLKPAEAPVLPNGPRMSEQVREELKKPADQVTGDTSSHSAKSPDQLPGDRVLLQHVQLGENEVPLIISESKEKCKPNKLAKGAHMEHKMRLRRIETELSMDIGVDNVFCPPPMYYSQSTREPKENMTEIHSTVEPETDSDPLEELDSAKTCESFEMTLSTSRLPESRSETTSRLKPQVQRKLPQSDPGNHIQQLPLLNALLMELSLLHEQIPQRIPLTVHPQLAWLYSGLENDSPEFHKPTSSTSERPRSISSNFKKHKERFQKYPISLKHPDKENTPKQTNTKKDSEHPKRKLMYGLTHTLRLRLQQSNPDMLILHEQRELSRKKQLKERKTKGTRHKGKEEKGSSTRLQDDQHLPGTFSFQSGRFEENIETLIQNSVDLHSSKVLRNGKIRGKNNFRATSELESANSKETIRVQPLGPLNHCAEVSDLQKLNKATNSRSLVGKDVKISLPKLFNHDSDHSINETHNKEADALQISEMNPDFTIDAAMVEDSDARISFNSYNGSPDPKYSEDFTSPEATGFSEDFTSPEHTSRHSDKLGSSTEAASTRVKHIYSNNESESSLSKYFSDDQGADQSEREDDSFLLPMPSEQSPVRSLKGIYIVKSHHQRLALSAVSNQSDDATSSIEGNQLKNILNPAKKEENKKQCKSTVPHGSRSDINPASTEVPQLSSSTNGHRSLEESQSLGTSQVSSYVPSSVSDLACSGLEMNTQDIQKEDDVNELGMIRIVNECRHISELTANKLPGYTL
ncbi:microtubule-associated protein 10 [Heterodontus francisci]|uniref:microtubule-associated protein 10 n=1 Tax=Heterodontus francisci TaxID=7792 RepID=UPI00355AE5DD